MKKPNKNDFVDKRTQYTKALEAWGDEMNDTRAENLQMNKNLAKDNLDLQKQVEKLLPYVKHWEQCPTFSNEDADCTCGLNKLIDDE